MASMHAREHQVLVALRAAPLDRLHLMKTLFLYWHRRGRPADGPFNFRPYMFGPCAFDLYTVLDRLEGERLVSQSVASSSADYLLTDAGRQEALRAANHVGLEATKQIEKIAQWASRETFHSLLRAVYSEAPDFATRSVVRR